MAIQTVTKVRDGALLATGVAGGVTAMYGLWCAKQLIIAQIVHWLSFGYFTTLGALIATSSYSLMALKCGLYVAGVCGIVTLVAVVVLAFLKWYFPPEAPSVEACPLA